MMDKAKALPTVPQALQQQKGLFTDQELAAYSQPVSTLASPPSGLVEGDHLNLKAGSLEHFVERCKREAVR
jgi:hypothetical protein